MKEHPSWMVWDRRGFLWLLLVGLFLYSGFAEGAKGGTGAGGDALAIPWKGPDGEALPFENEAEVLGFLRTAQVIRSEPIPVGVTKPRKVLLEKDGIRAHAVFRHLQEFKRYWKTARGLKVSFRDSCMFEIAAYNLSRLIGLNKVPPTVPREIDGKKGSLQIWVEDAMTERKRVKEKLQPPRSLDWVYQYQGMLLFDALTYNDDRNQGNLLIDRDWNLWFIDSTRAFRPHNELKESERLRFCPRIVWERLNSVDDESLRESVAEYLDGFELKTLLRRRARLVKLLSDLIEERGEKVVLWGPVKAAP